MPHIHPLYDFVTSVFVVHEEAVLLVFHRHYNRWLPIGGHIELNEDPEQGLFREIQEESGLEVTILSSKPDFVVPGVKPILKPHFMDVHDIRDNHKHIAFIYVGKSSHRQVQLHEREHSQFQWFTQAEVQSHPSLDPSIRYYALEALRIAK